MAAKKETAKAPKAAKAPTTEKVKEAAPVLNEDGTPATTPEQEAANRTAMDEGFLHTSGDRPIQY